MLLNKLMKRGNLIKQNAVIRVKVKKKIFIYFENLSL